MASERALRSLKHLQASASSARTLNLISVWKKHGEEEGYSASPFFKSPLLNRSMILKHRLRHDELEILPGRATGTKIILPIDITDLGTGGRSFLVGQKGYEEFLADLGCTFDKHNPSSRDDKLLRLMDKLPSLDPFLMRERLKKDGFNPDHCYFDLTDADAARMFNFVRSELTPLIGVSFGDMNVSLGEKTTKLATKILANASDVELDPLRLGMGMSKPDFEEGVFCWKGFIYYKWSLSDLLPQVRPVSSQIASIRPAGRATEEERTYIVAAQERLTKAIGRACQTVRVTLKVYDDAYVDLTSNGHPEAFKQFLLKAPNLFYELGGLLGSVHHIVSFWHFRFPNGVGGKIWADELVDLLADFEASLDLHPVADLAA